MPFCQPRHLSHRWEHQAQAGDVSANVIKENDVSLAHFVLLLLLFPCVVTSSMTPTNVNKEGDLFILIVYFMSLLIEGETPYNL